MQKEFYEDLTIEYTSEQQEEVKKMDKDSAPLFLTIAKLLKVDASFAWEYDPTVLSRLFSKGLKKEIPAAFAQLEAAGMIFPIPGISHKKYGRLFIIAPSPKASRKIHHRLYKLKHLFQDKKPESQQEQP